MTADDQQARAALVRTAEQEAPDDVEPDDVRHARQVEDDYAEAARQAAYVAAGR